VIISFSNGSGVRPIMLSDRQTLLKTISPSLYRWK